MSKFKCPEGGISKHVALEQVSDPFDIDEDREGGTWTDVAFLPSKFYFFQGSVPSTWLMDKDRTSRNWGRGWRMEEEWRVGVRPITHLVIIFGVRRCFQVVTTLQVFP
jgi:hypothetical protein